MSDVTGFINDETVRAGAAALITALATTAVVSLNEWGKARGADKRGASQLQLAKEQLAVLSTWADINTQLNPGTDPATFRAVIQSDLDAAIEAVRRTHEQAHREGPPVTFGHAVSLVLLNHLIGGVVFKLVRFFYWCSLAFLFLLLPFTINAVIAEGASSGWDEFFTIVAVIVEFAIPLLLWRWLAKFTSRRYARRQATAPVEEFVHAGG